MLPALNAVAIAPRVQVSENTIERELTQQPLVNSSGLESQPPVLLGSVPRNS